MEYICHSGGCPGADMEWENECEKYGIKTIAYSFWNHVQEGKNQKILSPVELDEGFEQVKIASQILKLPVDNLMNYQKNLLSRNWFQVKNSDTIFAIGTFGVDNVIDDNGHIIKSYKSIWKVNGGTGWAVQMAINANKNIWVFDQDENSWYMWFPSYRRFAKMNSTPKLTEKTTDVVNFAGIGTRDINKNGILAIKEILYNNFY